MLPELSGEPATLRLAAPWLAPQLEEGGVGEQLEHGGGPAVGAGLQSDSAMSLCLAGEKLDPNSLALCWEKGTRYFWFVGAPIHRDFQLIETAAAVQ